MNKIVLSSPGESSEYKRFVSQGTALPDSPRSRKTYSVVSPKDPFKSMTTQAKSVSSQAKSARVEFAKSNQGGCAQSMDSQAQINQFEGSPLQYYKTKAKMQGRKVEQLEQEIKELKADNEKIRNLNMDYVHQINIISHEKLKAIEKIVITSDVFDIENIEQKSVKAFIRKLANNYKNQEREQKKLIDHCKVMQTDLEFYKTKMAKADQVLKELKDKGKNSIDELLDELKELTNNNKQLEEEKAQLTQNYEILKHNQKLQQNQFEEVNQNLQQSEANLVDLKTKHNRLLKDKEGDEQSTRKQLYQLKNKCEQLEYSLRKSSMQLQTTRHSKMESDIKYKELDMMNQTLVKTTSGFFNAKKHLKSSTGFRFK